MLVISDSPLHSVPPPVLHLNLWSFVLLLSLKLKGIHGFEIIN